jgi:hypothetical protein
VDEWLDEDVDFAPRRRLPRQSADSAVVLELELETAEPDAEPAEAERDDDYEGATVHPLHGRFVHAESARGGGTLEDDRFLAPPPPDGERRTVHITGRPEAARAPLPSRRIRPRTTADRVGPRPDKIALYAFILGILLILIALSSASPS